ncbi:SH3 domain-containing protein [Sphingomonas sp.]|jgi:SH3-like domain-containing protein|uniref:SH3 domain-containing protein n=1 Tax=Sphingomonas sp. TaxID=28214 RepID=UPI0035C85E38
MRRVMVAILAMLVAVPPAAAATEEKKPPYYASLAPARARMRTGPGRTFPASWLYVRADLPVRVVATFKEWRKVEDPSGTQGWMLGNLISNRRTAIVQGGSPAEMRDRPGGPHIAYRAEPGVIGRLSACANGWCRFDVQGRTGFIQTDRLWGVDAGETLP